MSELKGYWTPDHLRATELLAIRLGVENRRWPAGNETVDLDALLKRVTELIEENQRMRTELVSKEAIIARLTEALES